MFAMVVLYNDGVGKMFVSKNLPSLCLLKRMVNE